jgi:hypothetical protein
MHFYLESYFLSDQFFRHKPAWFFLYHLIQAFHSLISIAPTGICTSQKNSPENKQNSASAILGSFNNFVD